MESRKVFKNASWLIGVQIVRAVVSLVISMLTARFLGPASFGLINYAASIVAFAAPVMYLGLTGILVQELINHPEREGETLGTAVTMSFFSSLLCIVGIFAFVSGVNAGETEILIVCLLYSLLLIFQSFDLVQYWFQAKLLSKYASLASFVAYLVVALYKVFLLVTDKSVYWFAVSNALDYFLIAVLLLAIYRVQGGQRFRFSWQVAKGMLRRSYYYILSDLMITVFAQTDRIMLKLKISDEATGYYSAAVACAGMTAFVFSAVIDSLRPMIFESKKEQDTARYERSIICLYSIILYLSLLQSVVVTLAAPLIVGILYGAQYAGSVAVLRIIVWYSSFSYLGAARAIWILAEGKQKHLVVLNLVGAVANVGLNLVLIPRMGASGAAIATVITQLMVNIVFTAVYPPTRRNGYFQLKALDPRCLVTVYRSLRGKPVGKHEEREERS